MLRAEKLSWIGLLVFALCAATVAFANPPAAPANTAANNVTLDEDYPDFENSRVARITVVRGDAQIRRAGKTEWETAAPNVPLMEGDRLATSENSRLEIQFGFRNYLRVDEYSLLKVVTLRTNGVALSLPEGAVSLRVSEFDAAREYFEIDAPATTVAVKRTGLYRVDSPRESDDRDVRVTVTGGGEARVYTEASGFTARNGRMARVFTTGNYAGDFELVAARSFSDDFDRWSAEREDRLARRRYESRSYYDGAIYGADELADYGEWIYTDNYGYIWRPAYASLSGYRNWSPYRYGHWRYLPRYGWTWIAAEPWGWATSHYGRWVWVRGGWAWCPYDSYRSRRIFWQPSLAIFINFGRNTYWCPLPYRYGYRYGRNRSRTIVYNNTTVIVNNTTIINNNQAANDPTPTGLPGKLPGKLPAEYETAITGLPTDKLGALLANDSAIPAQPELIKQIWRESTPIVDDRKLPAPSDDAPTIVKKDREIVAVKRDRFGDAETNLETGKIGASKRETGVQLDEKLRTERIFSNRTPDARKSQPEENSDVKQSSETVRTGVFDRRNETPGYRQDDRSDDENADAKRPAPRSQKREQESDGDDRPVFVRPDRQRDDDSQSSPDVKPPRAKQRDDDYNDRKDDRPPIYSPPPTRREEPKRAEEPRYEPPPKREEQPRYEPPPRREEPRNDPPKQRDEPRPAPPSKSNDDAKPPGKPDRDNRR